MPIFELYSKRKSKRDRVASDVYKYDAIPQKFRVQFVQIVQDAILLPDFEYSNHYQVSLDFYEKIVKKLRREEGVFQLPGTTYDLSGQPMHWPEELFNYLGKCTTNQFLDALEFICISLIIAPQYYENAGIRDAKIKFLGAIEEINYRLKDSDLGYQIVDSELIRVDSQLIHSDAVVPVLEILKLPRFKGAQAEFLKAHEHYRHRRNAEALNECYKSFESIMKSICDKQGWVYDKNWSAARLVDVCIKGGLIPLFYQQHMTGLRSILESAIPTPRNKAGAHGAGSTPAEVPDALTTYVIHLTASTLLYLATMERNLR